LAHIIQVPEDKSIKSEKLVAQKELNYKSYSI
jgi:hypothetical protein